MSVVEADEFAEQMDKAVDFLAHYGVRGMKWGVRKKSGGVDRAKRFGPKSKSGVVKEAPSEDANRVNQINGRVKAQKSTQMLSNKELQTALERMRLEQAYSQMTGGLDKTRKQKARAFLQSMIDDTVKGGQQSSQVVINKEVSAKMNSAFNNMKKKGAARAAAKNAAKKANP